MVDSAPSSTRRTSFIAWFGSGLVVSITMLVLWPFPIELQLLILFAAFLLLALLRIGYRKPTSPLGFAIGSIAPYVVVRIWLGSLAGGDGSRPEPPPSSEGSAAEESGK